jgi:hypothetical protein
MSGRGIATLIVKLVWTLVLTCLLWLAALFAAMSQGATEVNCELVSGCNWLEELYDGASLYTVVFPVCLFVAAGLVWAIPLARRRRASNPRTRTGP